MNPRMLAVLAFLMFSLMAPDASALPSVPLPSPDSAVSRTGAAVTQIPIPIPPGTGGFQPNLRLVYSSNGGDGLFGIGWSLTLSEIRRSTRDGMPTFDDDDDKFELDGQLLIPSATSGRYHTLSEGFQRIETQMSGSEIDTWEVTSPSGVLSIYGTTPESEVQDPLNRPTRWLLSEQVSPRGTRICFDYDQEDNYPRLRSVKYTVGLGGSCTSATQGTEKLIEVDYATRSDTRRWYSAGVESVLTRRATAIRVSAEGLTRRRLALDYSNTTGHERDRSRLSSVRLFACAGGACMDEDDALPVTTYTMAAEPAGAIWTSGGHQLPSPVEQADGNKSIDLGWRTGDVDGDGRPDLVRSFLDESSAEFQEVYLSTPSGFEHSPSWTTALQDIRFFTAQMKVIRNGNNVTDVQQDPYVSGMYFAEERPWEDHVQEDPDESRYYRSPINARFVDMNGDRRADLVASFRPVQARINCNPGCAALIEGQQTAEVWLNVGDGWVRSQQLSQAWDDDDQDGLPPFEAFFLKEKHSGSFNLPGDSKCILGSCTTRLVRYPAGVHLADVDGNRRLDVLASRVCDSSCSNTAINLQDGVFLQQEDGFYPSAGFAFPADTEHVARIDPIDLNFVDTGVRYVDVNGDGLADLVKGKITGDLNFDAFTNEGVWLSTGAGWCGSGCGSSGTNRYIPPIVMGNYTLNNGYTGNQVLFLDLNGDGLVDLARADAGNRRAWLQDPTGTGLNGVWKPAPPAFDPPMALDSVKEVNFVERRKTKGVLLADFDANGTPDFLKNWLGGGGNSVVESDYSTDSVVDRLASIQNGEGGEVRYSYVSLAQQRDFNLGIELHAAFDAGAKGEFVTFPLGDLDYLWTSRPVVEATAFETTGGPLQPLRELWYAYASPAWDRTLRVSFGPRIVWITRSDGSFEERYYRQSHGLAGRVSRQRLGEDGSQGFGVNEGFRDSSWNWTTVAGTTVNGSTPGTRIGRLLDSSASNVYGTGTGANQTIRYGYSNGVNCADAYNFACTIEVERPSGNSVTIREPRHLESPWILGLVAHEWVHEGLSAAGDLRRETTFTHDPDYGELTMRDSEAGLPLDGGATSVTEIWAYTPLGNVLSYSDPLQRVTSFCYDGGSLASSSGTVSCDGSGSDTRSLLSGYVDPLGEATLIERDVVMGVLDKLTSFNGDITDPELDLFGRVVRIETTPSATGAVTPLEVRHHEDGIGGYVETTQHTGDGTLVESRSYFDGFGRSVRETGPGNVGAWAGVARSYGFGGRVLNESMPQGCGFDPSCAALTPTSGPNFEQVYDALGRVVSVDRKGSSLDERIASYRYASSQKSGASGASMILDATTVARNADTLSETTSYLTDGSRTVFVRECGQNSNITVCLGPDTTHYEYEVTGEPRTIYNARAVAASDWNNAALKTEFAYDMLGQTRDVIDPNGGTRHLNYDPAGNLVRSENAESKVTRYVYGTPLDQLTRIEYDDGRPDANIGYDNLDPAFYRQRKNVRAGTYDYDYEYDEFGRVARETLTTQGEILLTDFRYDLLGRTIFIWYPGTSATYDYEGAHLVEVRGSGQTWLGVTYDDVGRPDHLIYPGATIDHGYDARSDLTNLHFAAPTGGALLDLEFFYTTSGNLTRITDSTPAANSQVPLDATYTYDKRGRVREWTPGSGSDQDFWYDDLGNLTRRESLAGDQVLIYDDLNHPSRLQAVKAFGGTPGPSFSYDLDGNRTHDPQAAQHYTYNSSGNLIGVGTTSGSTNVAQHGYDLDGRRIFTIANGETTVRVGELFEYNKTTGDGLTFVFAFGQAIGSRHRNPESLRTADTPWVPFGELPGSPWLPGALALSAAVVLAARLGAIAMVRRRPLAGGVSVVVAAAILVLPAHGGPPSGPASTFRWYVNDLVGSATVIWDGNGSVVARRQFEPYGQVVADWSTEVTDTRYAGHRLHVSTGLHDFGARWYDSATGSFMSVDPLIADLVDPQQHNPYAYARGNPVVLSDPTGLFTDYSAALGSECGGSCGGGSTSISIGGSGSGADGSGRGFDQGSFFGFNDRGPDFSSLAGDGGSAGPFTLGGTEARFDFSGSIDISNQVSPAARQQSQPSEQAVPSAAFVAGAATNAAGLAVGGSEAANVQSGQWRASNTLKDGTRPFYEKSFRGNQYTGGRNAVLSRGAAFRLVGRTFFGLGTALSIGDASQGNISLGQAAQDVTVGAIGTFGGPLGLLISGSYFGSQAAVGFLGLDPAALRTAAPLPSGY